MFVVPNGADLLVFKLFYYERFVKVQQLVGLIEDEKSQQVADQLAKSEKDEQVVDSLENKKGQQLVGLIADEKSQQSVDYHPVTYQFSIKSNHFDKPNEPCQTCLSMAMAKNGALKRNFKRIIYKGAALTQAPT